VQTSSNPNKSPQDLKARLAALASQPKFVLEETPPLTREWCRIPIAVQLFGIPRSRLFDLIRDRAIRSASLTYPGKKRGIRLVHIPSLAAYIEANAIGGKG
jgi:hypothetical protein